MYIILDVVVVTVKAFISYNSYVPINNYSFIKTILVNKMFT